MTKLILPLLLIACGIFIIIQGTRREDSVVGVSEAIGTSVANAWDGKARQPDHIWYYVGGGALILAGAGLALRKTKA
jgi:hypothetical protein